MYEWRWPLLVLVLTGLFWLREHPVFFVYRVHFRWLCPLNILGSVFTGFISARVIVCLCLFLWISFSQTHGWCLCQCCPASAGQILTCSFASPSWVLCQLLAGTNRCTAAGGKVGNWKLPRRAVLQAKPETKLWPKKRGSRADLAGEHRTDQVLWLFAMVDLTTRVRNFYLSLLCAVVASPDTGFSF